MKSNQTTAALALALGLTAGGASAAPMFIDLSSIGTPGEYFFATPGNPVDDGDDVTANFTEFGFTQLLATSIYDFTDGDVLGAFTDTNNAVALAAAGVPTSGTALDGSTPVSLADPVAPGQIDIDALSPLSATDNEGYKTTWELLVDYSFTGNLTAGGPQYTGGTIELIFSEIGSVFQQTVLTGNLVGSNIAAANLDLFFDVDSALDGFLWVENSQGTFVNVNNAYLANGGTFQLALDTNVNPPVPTADQLLLVGTNAIRQTTLDGSVVGTVPSPGVLSLMGLGLLGFGAARRKKSITG